MSSYKIATPNKAMRYNPCQNRCQSDGSHCLSCGRSIEEILATGALVNQVVGFLQQQDYDNPEAFVAALSKAIVKQVS